MNDDSDGDAVSSETRCDWRVRATLNRADLLNYIARLEEYHREGRVEVIVSAADREEALALGVERVTRIIGIPRDCIRSTLPKRLI